MSERKHQAFDASRVSIYQMAPEDVTIIGVDTNDDETHPLYDGRIHVPLEEATVLDMMENGVHVPIEVTKDGTKAIVIDGRRRVLHAREANKRLKKKGILPLRIKVMPPDREDTVLNRAKKAKRIMDRGYSEEDVAKMCKVSTRTIQNWVALLALDSRVQKAVDRGDVSASAAAEWIDESKADQRELLDKLLAEGENGSKPKRKTAKDTRAAANKKNGHDKPIAPSKRFLRTIVLRGAAPAIGQQYFLQGIGFSLGLIAADKLPDDLKAVLADPQRLVDEFNKKHPVGTEVLVWTFLKEGDGKRTVTTSAAELLGGHTAVVWCRDVRGCVALSHVEAVT